MKCSGISMASPQVVDLAAKLFAFELDLTVARMRRAILEGAEGQGRVQLIQPRRSAELVDLQT